MIKKLVGNNRFVRSLKITLHKWVGLASCRLYNCATTLQHGDQNTNSAVKKQLNHAINVI